MSSLEHRLARLERRVHWLAVAAIVFAAFIVLHIPIIAMLGRLFGGQGCANAGLIALAAALVGVLGVVAAVLARRA